MTYHHVPSPEERYDRAKKYLASVKAKLADWDGELTDAQQRWLNSAQRKVTKARADLDRVMNLPANDSRRWF